MTDQSREEVAQYDFQGAKVRAVVIDGEPALVGKDVCEALGIKNSRGRDPFVSATTRITGKGRQYFMRKLMGGDLVA